MRKRTVRYKIDMINMLWLLWAPLRHSQFIYIVRFCSIDFPFLLSDTMSIFFFFWNIVMLLRLKNERNSIKAPERSRSVGRKLNFHDLHIRNWISNGVIFVCWHSNECTSVCMKLTIPYQPKSDQFRQSKMVELLRREKWHDNKHHQENKAACNIQAIVLPTVLPVYSIIIYGRLVLLLLAIQLATCFWWNWMEFISIWSSDG